jgi:NAD(P)-dependent dehydrogenase (short-subunit alcohol dehydrogenase family)
MTEWHYLENGQSIGPLSKKQIVSRLNQAPDQPHFVWTAGMPEWADARELPEFSSPPPRQKEKPPKERPPQKVILVTGATSGIGRACAQVLKSKGWRVFGSGRNVDGSSSSADGVEMIAINVDDKASVQAGVAEVLARAGRLDAIVNNAGYSLMGAVEDTSIEEAKAQLETNFFGAMRVIQAALPALRASGGGYIINISSLAGIVGLPFSGLYSASKFALEGMSESLRLETRRFGIRVVLVEPGDFRTQTTANRRIAEASKEGSLYKEVFDKVKRKQDHDEMTGPTPEPVARLVEHILRQKNPKTRYSVGMPGQRIVSPLKRLLPQSVFEQLFRSVVGV